MRMLEIEVSKVISKRNLTGTAQNNLVYKYTRRVSALFKPKVSP